MKKVILNVGHGGVKRDPGACGNGFEEHAWNKDFVENYVKKECEAQEVPYVIIYQDYYSKLPDKINNLANKGDITLSFHLNEATHLKDRKILPRDYADRGATLLRKTSTPCVIVESGFITNSEDMKVLEATKKELAKYYVAAVKNYWKNN